MLPDGRYWRVTLAEGDNNLKAWNDEGSSGMAFLEWVLPYDPERPELSPDSEDVLEIVEDFVRYAQLGHWRLGPRHDGVQPDQQTAPPHPEPKGPPKISFTITSPEPTIIVGIQTSTFGSCYRSWCDNITTWVIEPRADRPTSAFSPSDLRYGLCADHQPRLITQDEDAELRRAASAYPGLPTSTFDTGWPSSAYTIREINQAEQEAIEAQFHFDPPATPEGRIARWRRIADGGRENTIDGKKFRADEAGIVVAVLNALSEDNQHALVSRKAVETFNIAARLAGLA
ncbi:hypothetical protein [Actinomadura hibisca]|uniref:hypothetical protein n=1 Tax=Actinomadura hibisca TaxID=68565 RepID=UPI0012F78282|nr:hypothetical protein [Actinomadura hibisca]